MAGVGAYFAAVDRVLLAGQSLFPQGGPGVEVTGSGGSAPSVPTSGVSGLSDGAESSGREYRAAWAATAGVDGDAAQTAAAGDASGQAGRSGAVGVRASAQSAAAAIAPATGSPAGVRLMVSAMDDRLAAMQRQIDTARSQNQVLATRMRQLALAYRSMGGAPMGAMTGGGGSMMGAAMPAAMGGLAGGMPSLGSLTGGPAAIARLSGLPAAFTQRSQSASGARGLEGEVNTGGGSAAERAVAFAKSKIGRPYVWGAVGPNAYDCSGLTMDAYRHAGISLPRHTYEQMRVGASIPRGNIAPGDRIYCNFSGPGRPEHVMLAISSTMAIEAPAPGQRVHITSIPTGYIEVRRGGARH